MTPTRSASTTILPPPIPCSECNGAGCVSLMRHGWHAEPAGHAPTTTCPKCFGSKVEACWLCDLPATQRFERDTFVCEEHAQDDGPADAASDTIPAGEPDFLPAMLLALGAAS